MILYKGQLYEDHEQSGLITRLGEDLYTPFREGRSLDREKVIRAFGRLVTRIRSGEFDDVVKPLIDAFGVSQSEFERMTDLFSEEKLRYKCEIELCDEEKIIDGRIRRVRMPYGVILHIAAGNVDFLPAYSVAEGLLSGNVNILKLPMGDSGLSVRLLHELVKTEPSISDFVYVFDVPSKDTVTLRKFAELSDVVAVWGGDEASMAARTMADVKTKIVTWGHKLSFAYCESDADDEELLALCDSICSTNQLLCSSCQGIFLDTGDMGELEAFAERFYDIFRRSASGARPVDIGMRAKNAINMYNERLERPFTGHRVLSDGNVGVIISDDEELELSYLYRNVWIKKLPAERLFTLRKHKGHLQTAAVITSDDAKRKKLRKILADVGVTKVTFGGNMNRIVAGQAHDGTYALREYTKIVEFDEERDI